MPVDSPGWARPLALGASWARCYLHRLATTAVLVNWSRHHWLRSEYAPPLLLEAALLLPVRCHYRQTPFAVPLTVLVTGLHHSLQNALVSKILHCPRSAPPT
jgi:hypothetical protein